MLTTSFFLFQNIQDLSFHLLGPALAAAKQQLISSPLGQQRFIHPLKCHGSVNI